MSRTKQQWIEETGGFRLGELPELFQLRVRAIQTINHKIKNGIATVEDIERLRRLKGLSDFDDNNSEQESD